MSPKNKQRAAGELEQIRERLRAGKPVCGHAKFRKPPPPPRTKT